MADRGILPWGAARALSAALLLGGCGATPVEDEAAAAAQDSAVAALVNAEAIYVSDVNNEARVQSLIAGDEKLETESAEFNEILDQLIDIKLLAQEAIARGLDEDPQARHRLETARENILGNILVDTVVGERVDEGAVRKMYDTQVAILELGDEAHVRHILAPTKDAIDRIAAELKTGADFAVLASKKSTDTATRMEGGDLGYISADGATPEFAKVIRETSAGAISKPFETEMGWHLAKIEERRKEPPPSIEELRGAILKHLTMMQIGEVLKELRTEAKIEKQTSPRNSTLDIDPFETTPDEPAATPAPPAAKPAAPAAKPAAPAGTAAAPAAKPAAPAAQPTPPAARPATSAGTAAPPAAKPAASTAAGPPAAKPAASTATAATPVARPAAPAAQPTAPAARPAAPAATAAPPPSLDAAAARTPATDTRTPAAAPARPPAARTPPAAAVTAPPSGPVSEARPGTAPQ